MIWAFLAGLLVGASVALLVYALLWRGSDANDQAGR